ncbi:periplasmic thioredoxin of cytochrome c-type biogenesis (plasmid) [Cupriavidus taiwanensis]|uniref:Periplasmic thioredoxin of cytochrome c-type biogenesis n=1 Tax=Cupriavidus taiwanensis TaxID=164546 RepID=A0A375IL89_9BURK|nr:DsbE family thiol:disulfide interchange protein [Cupriavidus taiwanensis]SPK75466.1 periplasmic thioredoxin of cytochrome c-type biogenesis [Cupriavidus taiwanensis]
MTRFLLPLAAFVALAVALAAGLRHDPRALPSPLVGKVAPAFQLPLLAPEGRTLASADLRGKVWLLNVWASWCAACRTEHPLLVDFAGRAPVPLYGLNYKDEAGAARDWLRRLGDPYAASLVDADGRVGIDYGVYGVPETFVIDQHGVVRYRQVGPVTREVLERKLIPLIEQLQRQGDGHA